MNLMIVESPGKIAKLEAILGRDWKVAASIGHIRDMPVNDMGVEAPNFQPRYDYIPGRPIPGKPGKVYPSSKERVDRLAALARQADAVYLATDPDREGESISWHLQECLKLRNPLRITFNEVTASAVNAAVRAPRAIDSKLVSAQEGRRVLDRLVGYMVSPVLQHQTGERLSAGRVQSVAVRLVVDRERAIRAFRPTQHFGAKLFFAGAKAGWSATWDTEQGFTSEDEPHMLNPAFARAAADQRELTVLGFEEGEKKRSPPGAFTTSTLQQAASVSLGMKPKATMDAAQRLFDQGHITYHRTDNPNVSDDSLADIHAVAGKLGLELADRPRRFKAAEGAQEGHPAITPTHWEVDEAGEAEEERALYRLIRTRAIACQLTDAIYAVRSATLQGAEVDGRPVIFKALGRTLVRTGWLKLVNGDAAEEDEGEAEPLNAIPVLSEGATVVAEHGEVLDQKTKAPKRYSEASLVKKLEAEGIGRPATYAAIMEGITGRRYVRTEKKYLVPSDTGELIVESLAGRFAFIDLGFTRSMETELDRIAHGQAVYRAVVGRLHDQLQAEVNTLQASVAPKYPCAECGKAMRRIKRANGYFWGCTGFPDCNVSVPDATGEPGVRAAISEHKCGRCGSGLVHRVKGGKGGFNFWGCSAFKAGCKQSYPDSKGVPLMEERANNS